MIGFPWSLYPHTIFLCNGEKYTSKTKYLPELIKRRSKVQDKNVMGTRFEFWPMKNLSRKLLASVSLIMACLQIYWELLLLATFLRVQSNSKEISNLSWQNNLKTTCHIKLKFFLWTKLLENLLLVKYLISVTATLKIIHDKNTMKKKFV